MDPVTISLAVGVASKAFDAIKSGFAMGRDLEQMSGDLSRWMGASSDIDQAEKQAKNPHRIIAPLDYNPPFLKQVIF